MPTPMHLLRLKVLAKAQTVKQDLTSVEGFCTWGRIVLCGTIKPLAPSHSISLLSNNGNENSCHLTRNVLKFATSCCQETNWFVVLNRKRADVQKHSKLREYENEVTACILEWLLSKIQLLTLFLQNPSRTIC